MSPVRLAEREAARARKSLSKLEREAALAREKGERLPEAFWVSFGAAYASVQLAERAVSKAREKAR